MILEELSSNLPSFHAIRFKKGLNFIIGKKTAESDEKGSYNGVGKSLVIELIHFCLGANKVKALSVIGHYYCTLKFSHKNCSYSIKRFFDDNQDVYFDDKLILLSDLKQKLYNLIFDNNKKINNVGFRSLISRYIRRYKANYTSYYNFVKKESSEVELLNNGLVLGIDADTIVSKIDNKEKLTELNRTKKSLKSDKILLDYFTGKYSIDFKIRDLNDKLKKLYDEKKNFKIAENYYDLKKQADDLSQQIRNLNNQKFLINSRIQRIDKMMGTNISVSDQELKDLYSEIEKYIKIENLKQINDLMKFHNALNFNREEAFKSQKNDYENQLLDLNLKISNKNEELSLLLKNLSDSGALEDYNNLCSEITQTETNLKKITDYKNLMKQYEMEINISKKKKTEITISNQLYIDNHKNDFDELMDLFRKFSRQFYNDKPSGLSVILNSKDNKIAYDIEADIEGDSSDGINEVKIFCFDMTILKKAIFDVNFLFHDSRLLADMDPRQRNVWLDIISNEFHDDSEYQYISSINEDVILTMKDVATGATRHLIDEVFNKDNIRLVLTDESPESKLLGKQINLKYDK